MVIDAHAAQSADTQPQADTHAAQSANTTQDTPATQDTATIERPARSDSREGVTLPIKAGIPQPHTAEKREHARVLFLDNKTGPEIAYETQIPVGTIYAWANRYDWKTQKLAKDTGVSAETLAKVVNATKPLTQATAEPSDLDLAEKQTRYQALMGDAAIRVAEHVATLEGKDLVTSADKLLKADQIARKALKLETEKPSTVIQIGVLAQSPSKRIEQAAPDTLTLDA